MTTPSDPPMPDVEAHGRLAEWLRRLNTHAVFLASRLQPLNGRALDVCSEAVIAARAIKQALVDGRYQDADQWADAVIAGAHRMNTLWEELLDPSTWGVSSVWARPDPDTPGGDLLLAHCAWAEASDVAADDPDHARAHLDRAAKRMAAALAPHQNDVAWAAFYGPVAAEVYRAVHDILRRWYRKDAAQLLQLQQLVRELRPRLQFPLRHVDTADPPPARVVAMSMIASVARDVSLQTVENALARYPASP